jgi:hypothetical protein
MLDSLHTDVAVNDGIQMANPVSLQHASAIFRYDYLTRSFL